MAKSSNQKAKILYLMELFMEETDEDHPISRKELEEKLADLGIHAERKSLYNDIETLKNFGMDILYGRNIRRDIILRRGNLNFRSSNCLWMQYSLRDL